MQDADIERPTNAPSSAPGQPATATTRPPEVPGPEPRKPHPWPLILGLTGLLGAVWAIAIVSRYPNILPG
ncbi:hypothetical protein MKK58_21650 [Methylobacterium sp. J-078]|uniref:hypothetical protein n=1 Tax=Methylobacterium sp. J-078 TaxID=2836657 RepID=UPI001FBA7D29|nr:hypothetical protein [Methylobacterium sp. J-078]MCJ2047122.1 hypothetical protein [Methylobacterium sp. J-078]